MTPRRATHNSIPQSNIQGDWGTVYKLLPYLWPAGELGVKARVVTAMLFLLLAKVATVTVPYIYKQTVDLIAADQNFAMSAMIGLVIGYGIARIAQQAFAELREFFFARIGQSAVRKIALRVFRHLHTLSLRFHLDRQTGGLSHAIERGVKGIEFVLNFSLFNIIPTLIEIALVCGILWVAFDIRYAAITFATLALYIAFTLISTEWRLRFYRRMNDMDSRANTRAIDSLLNYETVKYFSNEDYEAQRYDKSLRRYEDAAVLSKTSLALVNIGQGTIVALGVTAIMLLASIDVKADAMTVGEFVMVNTYLIQLFIPLNFLGFVYREIKHALTNMESMFQLLDEPRDITDIADALPLTLSGGTVTFRDVRFTYQRGAEVLKGVSFEIPPGKTIAIVGPSGAGKSTIARLLFRFYDVTGGAIEIDGQDIRSIQRDSLRRAVGVVPQDMVLFNDTIYYNIAYGRPDATPSEIEDAARHAKIHDFIAGLPDGYQTHVGERGLKISGGEKQRVAIARAILKRPTIFLFDEATSSLDTHTEQAIQHSLAEVSANDTTLMIAHRLSTIVNADEIIVLRDGAVAERGSHQALLARGEIYADMWRQQQESAED